MSSFSQKRGPKKQFFPEYQQKIHSRYSTGFTELMSSLGTGWTTSNNLVSYETLGLGNYWRASASVLFLMIYKTLRYNVWVCKRRKDVFAVKSRGNVLEWVCSDTDHNGSLVVDNIQVAWRQIRLHGTVTPKLLKEVVRLTGSNIQIQGQIPCLWIILDEAGRHFAINTF